MRILCFANQFFLPIVSGWSLPGITGGTHSLTFSLLLTVLSTLAISPVTSAKSLDFNAADAMTSAGDNLNEFSEASNEARDTANKAKNAANREFAKEGATTKWGELAREADRLEAGSEATRASARQARAEWKKAADAEMKRLYEARKAPDANPCITKYTSEYEKAWRARKDANNQRDSADDGQDKADDLREQAEDDVHKYNSMTGSDPKAKAAAKQKTVDSVNKAKAAKKAADKADKAATKAEKAATRTEKKADKARAKAEEDCGDPEEDNKVSMGGAGQAAAVVNTTIDIAHRTLVYLGANVDPDDFIKEHGLKGARVLTVPKGLAAKGIGSAISFPAVGGEAGNLENACAANGVECESDHCQEFLLPDGDGEEDDGDPFEDRPEDEVAAESREFLEQQQKDLNDGKDPFADFADDEDEAEEPANNGEADNNTVEVPAGKWLVMVGTGWSKAETPLDGGGSSGGTTSGGSGGQPGSSGGQPGSSGGQPGSSGGQPGSSGGQPGSSGGQPGSSGGQPGSSGGQPGSSGAGIGIGSGIGIPGTITKKDDETTTEDDDPKIITTSTTSIKGNVKTGAGEALVNAVIVLFPQDPSVESALDGDKSNDREWDSGGLIKTRPDKKGEYNINVTGPAPTANPSGSAGSGKQASNANTTATPATQGDSAGKLASTPPRQTSAGKAPGGTGVAPPAVKKKEPEQQVIAKNQADRSLQQFDKFLEHKLRNGTYGIKGDVDGTGNRELFADYPGFLGELLGLTDAEKTRLLRELRDQSGEISAAYDNWVVNNTPRNHQRYMDLAKANPLLAITLSEVGRDPILFQKLFKDMIWDDYSVKEQAAVFDEFIRSAQKQSQNAVKGLLLISETYVKQLMQYAERLGGYKNLTRKQKLELMETLRTQSGEVLGAYRNMVAKKADTDRVRPGSTDLYINNHKALYDRYMQEGKADKARETVWGNYLHARHKYVSLIDKYPLLGLNNGTVLYEKLQSMHWVDYSADEVAAILDEYVNDGIKQTRELIDKTSAENELEDLLKYGSGKYLRQQQAAALQSGLARKYVEEGKIAGATQDEDKAFERAITTGALAVVAGGTFFIPVVGPWVSISTSLLIAADEVNVLRITYVDLSDTETGAAITGYEHVLTANEKTDAQWGYTVLAAGGVLLDIAAVRHVQHVRVARAEVKIAGALKTAGRKSVNPNAGYIALSELAPRDQVALLSKLPEAERTKILANFSPAARDAYIEAKGAITLENIPRGLVDKPPGPYVYLTDKGEKLIVGTDLQAVDTVLRFDLDPGAYSTHLSGEQILALTHVEDPSPEQILQIADLIRTKKWPSTRHDPEVAQALRISLMNAFPEYRLQEFTKDLVANAADGANSSAARKMADEEWDNLGKSSAGGTPGDETGIGGNETAIGGGRTDSPDAKKPLEVDEFDPTAPDNDFPGSPGSSDPPEPPNPPDRPVAGGTPDDTNPPLTERPLFAADGGPHQGTGRSYEGVMAGEEVSINAAVPIQGKGDPIPLTATQSHVYEKDIAYHMEQMLTKGEGYKWGPELIVVDPKGNLVQGHHRVVAAQRTGTPIPDKAIFWQADVTKKPKFSSVKVRPGAKSRTDIPYPDRTDDPFDFQFDDLD